MHASPWHACLLRANTRACTHTHAHTRKRRRAEKDWSWTAGTEWVHLWGWQRWVDRIECWQRWVDSIAYIACIASVAYVAYVAPWVDSTHCYVTPYIARARQTATSLHSVALLRLDTFLRYYTHSYVTPYIAVSTSLLKSPTQIWFPFETYLGM